MGWRFAPYQRPPISREVWRHDFPRRPAEKAVWGRSEPLRAGLFAHPILSLVPTAIGQLRSNDRNGIPLSERLPHLAQRGEFPPIGDRG